MWDDELSISDDQRGIDDLWHLHDELTVEQAAALVAGYDPGFVALCKNDTNFDSRFSRLYPAMSALANAINGGRLKATIRRNARIQGWDEFPGFDEGMRALEEESDDWREDRLKTNVIFCEAPDWGKTTVMLEDLRGWLRGRGIHSGFFFPNATNAPDYLNPKNPRYAPKLAAALQAWQAVIDPGKKTPKQALEKWLREHAVDFGLVDDDGNPINTAIEECSKVANWNQSGGAPKTPT